MTPQERRRELRRLSPAQLRRVVEAMATSYPDLVDPLVEFHARSAPVPVPGQLELPR